MNQRVQLGLIVLNVLLIVLLCLYLEIPTRVMERFNANAITATDTGDGESRGESPSLEVPRGLLLKKKRKNAIIRIKAKYKLPQRIIDRIKTFVFFLGHPRSGHSIVASLMDSHPHMVISHEADLFTKLSEGSLAPTKPEIFNAVWDNTRTTIIDGKRAQFTNGKGYTLFVDGLYQGAYEDHIDVIGDKKAGGATKILQNWPDRWLNVFTTLNSLTDSLKVIHVIRNPYDNIATKILYVDLVSPNNKFGKIKQSNQTYKIDSDIIKEQIRLYFLYYQAIEDARRTYNLDMIEIHGKDLILDPRGTLLKLCNDLGVTCSDNYLEICSNKVFKTESRTRHMIKWTDEQLKVIQKNVKRFSSLKDYSFDSM